MKLEIGKVYRTRGAALNVLITGVNFQGHFVGTKEDGSKIDLPYPTWSKDGHYRFDKGASAFDLVGEVQPQDKDYLVTWRIDIGATSPEAAAEMAWEAIRDPHSTANVFVVSTLNGPEVRVDLSEERAATPAPSMPAPAESLPDAQALLRAVLEGKTVQWLDTVDGWVDYDSDLLDTVVNLAEDLRRAGRTRKFRIKPEPVVHWCVVTKDQIGTDIPWASGMSREEAVKAARDEMQNLGKDLAKVLRIELDPDSLKVIATKTEEA